VAELLIGMRLESQGGMRPWRSGTRRRLKASERQSRMGWGFPNVVMKLSPLSPDASRHEAVTWLRNWVALLTIANVVMLLILFVMDSADWILLVVFAAAVYGLRQVIDLTRKARKLGR